MGIFLVLYVIQYVLTTDNGLIKIPKQLCPRTHLGPSEDSNEFTDSRFSLVLNTQPYSCDPYTRKHHQAG